MTTLVPRSEWGARPRKPGTTAIIEHPLVTFHYVGGGWEYPWEHTVCDDKIRGIQADHMDNRDWSDIAYNYLVCPHDFVFEGRGYDRRSSANGSEVANNTSFAVCALWGTASADDPLPDGLKRAFMWARSYLMYKGGATSGIKGHRDWKSTDCPGDQIYAWIKLGCPLPVTTPPPVDEDDDMFSDQDRGRLNWVYGANVDGDGTPGTNTLLGRVLAKLETLEKDIEELKAAVTPPVAG